ncbi:hypothetical protein HUO13_24145 [Saccharopolyspora erythraea]|uniref:hypothetical protein n=1 Tax=Saccharopolyspora erythraea TaxID=1836 RepID=UPI001BAB5BBA|nr:hypothetical protein [Saccharopolyspora erythraea]QUH06202.1 hypothetical protein HUO13_24145 [Saccharopolyspora erythraea]
MGENIAQWPADQASRRSGFGFTVERTEQGWRLTYFVDGRPYARVGYDTREQLRDELNALFLGTHDHVLGLG